MKKLVEKRNELVEKVNALFASAEAETRSFDDAETAKYEDYMKEIADIDAQMKRIEEQRALKKVDFDEPTPVVTEPVAVDTEAEEIRSFEQYVREMRAENMTMGSNGAVVPSTIANKILEKVENISPIYGLATKFNVKGELSFPVADGDVTTGYQTEFTEIESSAVGFKSVKLGGFLVGALSKVSLSLVNNAQFDITSYVINKVAYSISKFLEKELLKGAGTTAVTGILTDTSGTVGKTQPTVLDVDALLEGQMTIPQANQENCRWLMNNKTLLALRQLKDGNGRYLLQDDVVNGFGFTILGKPVMISDNMDDDKIVYGDFSAVYVNIHEDINIQLLKEKYATEHAEGVVAWLELDAKPIESQKLVVIEKK